MLCKFKLKFSVFISLKKGIFKQKVLKFALNDIKLDKKVVGFMKKTLFLKDYNPYIGISR